MRRKNKVGQRRRFRTCAALVGLLVEAAGGPAVGSSPPSTMATNLPSTTPVPSHTVTLSGAIVQLGDSIGAGVAAGNWAAIDHLGLGGKVSILNVSTSGETLATGAASHAATLFGAYSPGRPSILLIQEGTNDLGSAGTRGADLYARTLTPLVASAHAAGFYVVVDTLLPRADGLWSQAKELERQSYNRLVRANGAKADRINDLASDPVLGDVVAPATSPYFADALHPSPAGQRRLAVLDAAALRPLLRRKARARHSVAQQS